MATTTPDRRADSKYRLFGAKGSGSAAVEFLLGELGVEHEVLDAAPWTDPPGTAFAELQIVSKYAQLPTVVAPGGEVLTESVAILWTLAERHSSEWLPLVDTRARAACLRWMTFIAGNVYAAIGVVDYPERWLTEPSQHEALRAGAKGRIALAWRTLARANNSRRLRCQHIALVRRARGVARDPPAGTGVDRTGRGAPGCRRRVGTALAHLVVRAAPNARWRRRLLRALPRAFSAALTPNHPARPRQQSLPWRARRATSIGRVRLRSAEQSSPAASGRRARPACARRRA